MLKQKAIEEIIACINDTMGIDIKDKTRKRHYVFGRAVAYTIMRVNMSLTLEQIAKVFNKNHASVVHSLKELPYVIKYDPEFKELHDTIVYNWLENVNNYTPVSGVELKTRLKTMIKRNKSLHLEIESLKNKGKKEKLIVKYSDLISRIEHKVPSSEFDSFKKKLNTLLNGM
tara:strand:+ start:669 stop:1184 length:516 start_codon:yes stop_codon:yes gene_type:complete